MIAAPAHHQATRKPCRRQLLGLPTFIPCCGRLVVSFAEVGLTRLLLPAVASSKVDTLMFPGFSHGNPEPGPVQSVLEAGYLGVHSKMTKGEANAWRWASIFESAAPRDRKPGARSRTCRRGRRLNPMKSCGIEIASPARRWKGPAWSGCWPTCVAERFPRSASGVWIAWAARPRGC